MLLVCVNLTIVAKVSTFFLIITPYDEYNAIHSSLVKRTWMKRNDTSECSRVYYFGELP